MIAVLPKPLADVADDNNGVLWVIPSALVYAPSCDQVWGVVDYFKLLFDSHPITYVKGIAAESMLINTRTKPVLPDTLLEALADHEDAGLSGLDVTENLLNRPDAAELLR